MSKTKRGKSLRRDGFGRGTCPVCRRGRVKLAWQAGKGEPLICKACYAHSMKKK